jgi:hypothetical protein
MAQSSKGDWNVHQSELCTRYFSNFETKEQMPAHLLRSVSLVESGRWSSQTNSAHSWPWTVNIRGKGYYFKDKATAVAKVKETLAKGIRSIDVGCMQINLYFHPEAFESIEQAFEPYHNIKYASEFLAHNYKKEGTWRSAVGRYHSANNKRNKPYTKKVFAILYRQIKQFDVALSDK